MIQQVALTPTLAMVMGVPIPYSSIGGIVPQLFKEIGQQTEALLLNMKQVHRYLSHYNTLAKLPHGMWEHLGQLKAEVDQLEEVATKGADEIDEKLLDKYKHLFDVMDDQSSKQKAVFKEMRRLCSLYLTEAKVMCEEVWATFDVNEMLGGILLMFLTVLNLFCIALSPDKKGDVRLYFIKGNVAMISIILSCLLLRNLASSILVLNYIPTLFGGVVLMFHFSKINQMSIYGASKEIIPLGLFFLFTCNSFSNSFVVYEDQIVAFILVSALAYLALSVLFIHKRSKTANMKTGKMEHTEPASTFTCCVTCAIFLAACVAIRCSQSYYRCREEQRHDCSAETTTNHLPLSSIDHSLKSTRFFTGLCMLAIIAYLPRRWFSYTGNLNGWKMSVIVARYSGIFLAVMIASYWALEAVPKPSAEVLSFINYPPRIVYATCFIATLVIFIWPLMIFWQGKRYQTSTSDPTAIVPKLLKDLSSNSSATTPVVYGLATALSSLLLLAMSLLVMVLVLLVGDGMIIPLCCNLVVMVACVTLHAIACCSHNSTLGKLLHILYY